MSKVIKKILSAQGRGITISQKDTEQAWLLRVINEEALEEDQKALTEDEEIKSELRSLQNDHANKVFVVEANNPTGQNTGNPGHFARIIGTQTGTATSATRKLQQRRRSNSSRTSFS